MSKIIAILLIVPIFLFICIQTPSGADENGPEVLKVKGLYIGMDIDDACKVVNQLFKDSPAYELGGYIQTPSKEEVAKVIWNNAYLCVYPQGSENTMLGQIFVFAGSDKKVNVIWIFARGTDHLFNTSGIETQDFAQQFMNSYQIPKMDPTWTNNHLSPLSVFLSNSGLEFKSSYGYKVIIDENKNIVIEVIPKQSDMKFN